MPGAEVIRFPAASLTNVEAEQALLGAALVNNAAYHAVAEFLQPEHFGEAVHGRIFAAIGALIDKGHAANPVTLKNLFDQDGALAEIGGATYLARLAASAVTIINARDYGMTLLDLWRRRRAMEDAQQFAAEIADHDLALTAAERVRQHIERLELILDGKEQATELVSDGAAAAAAIARAEKAYQSKGKLIGVPTGIAALDEMTGGLKRGHLDIIGGRTSMGKTLLADGIATAAARHFLAIAPAGQQPIAAVVVELEMTADELATRRLAFITGIDGNRIDRGWLSPREFQQLEAARADLARLPRFTIDRSGLTLTDIRALARRVHRKRGVGLLVVDHIGLIQVPPDIRRSGGTAPLTYITGGLKALAKELAIPVIALSQLNREADKRDNHRPHLADLRESGSIEQDADVVMLVYRPEYYLEREAPARRPGEADRSWIARENNWREALDKARGRAEIIVDKQRGGMTKTIEVDFDAARGLFGDRPAREGEMDF